MAKNDDSLESHIKEVGIAIAEPGKRIAGTIGHYLDALNPLVKNDTNNKPVERKASIKTLKHNNILWVDIENPTRKETNMLAEEYGFDTLHLKASLSRMQLSRVELEKNYVFILLNVPSVRNDYRTVTHQVCVFLGKNFIVTTHSENPHLIRELFEQCEKDDEVKNTYFKKSAGFLFYNILEHIIKNLSDIANETSQELDDIEDLVFDVKISVAYKISQLRQKIIRLRKITLSMKNVLLDLHEDKSGVVNDSVKRYFKSLTISIQKVWETLEETRETVEVYKDADFTVSTEKTNKILTVLTIIFTLTIPVTILGTFYGMNIILPGGVEVGSWTFMGEYTTLIVISTISFLMVLLMLWFFRFKDWF